MIYLISRDTQYSPNSEARDEAIFKAVALALSLQGEPIAAIDENRLPAAFAGADLVLSMARSHTAQTTLAAAESAGLTIWNSPAALLRHSRADLDGWFNEAGCGAPFLHKVTDPALIVRTLGLPLWLKRSDSAAKTADDVRFIADEDQLRAALADFASAGIDDFIVSAHLEGDLVKFYGVEGTSFFSHTYPTRGNGFSKFGLEQHNGVPAEHPFSVADLKTAAEAAALHFGRPIYGGDAIVRPDGRFFLIDFNDWPSFGSCTQAAAEAIATRTLHFLRRRA